MEEQLEQSKKRLHFCMAVIGGWFGAYMVLRFGHFASAATVNLLEMLTGAAQSNWELALLRLGGMVLYAFAVFLTAWLPKRTHDDLRLWAILIDMAAALVLSVIPPDREYAVYFSLFAMAFQWATFASKHGYPCSTIFSTNNLRQFVDACVQVYLNRDADHSPRMRLYGGTLLSFTMNIAGPVKDAPLVRLAFQAGLAVCVLWRMGLGHWTILGALLPAALALLWQRQDLRIRQAMGEKLV